MNQDSTDKDLPIIVGIGSSAGGLEAIRELAASLPLNNGCAYVVVQHMSPQHKSLLTSLISTETELNVVDIVDAMEPEPDVIYVTPPRADVIMADAKLRLVPHSEDIGKPKPSVDRFLVSLAHDRGEKSMGIILSGTGSDGAYGVQAVREAGGITIAQDDDSAKYDGMPSAAVSTGCVDLVLRPSDIGTHLNKILSSPRNLDQFRADSGEVSPISGILQIVLARTRVDFRDYKQSTVLRRIDRRMMALGVFSVEDYVVYCRNDPREVDALFKDLLISVTRFFRDRKEFDDLSAHIDDLVESHKDRPLRIWVAGCATGEEVYSIAMMLAEAMGGATELIKSKTQIFATDIDRAALDHARKGHYSQGALLDVPKELADKYFIQQSEGVRVIEALRSVILFSDHNLCQDPPFLNMDLICCRNLLIYFSAKLQARVFSRLHYALKQNAILFLGTAERVTGSDQLFAERSDNPHIFRKKALRKTDQVNTKAFNNAWSAPVARGPRPKPEVQPLETERLMFDALARSLGENAILVSADHTFLRVYGDITPYVNLTETSSLNLQLSLLKPPYREEARSLVTLALKHEKRRVGARHTVLDDGETVVRLEVMPIKASAIDESLALLVINTLSKAELERSGGVPSSGAELTEANLRELDDELATTREALQQTIEELETSNEELQSLNEELQSTNEELQATNEELETSNEELQSTNEELITVNEELQINSSELMSLNAELGSLLGNVPIPLLVLDNALQVARASQAAMRLFDITTPLRSPHLSQLSLPDGFPRMVEICNEALQLGTPMSIDFDTSDGPYTLQCAPFTGDAGQIIGSTLVFLRSPAVQSLANELQQLLACGPIYLLQHDEQGKVTRISNQMAETLGITPQEAIGLSVKRLLLNTGVQAENGLSRFVEGKTSDGTFSVNKPNGDVVWVSAKRHAYTDPGTGQVIVVILGSDVSEIMNISSVVDISTNSLKLVEKLADTGYWRIDLETNELFWSEKVFEIHGLKRQAPGPTLDAAIDAYHPDDRDMVQELVTKALQEHVGFSVRARLLREDGSAIWVQALAEVTRNSEGRPISLVGSFRDVTNEMSMETRLEQVETLIDRDDTGFCSYDVLTNSDYWSTSTFRLLRLDKKKSPSFDLFHDMIDKADQPKLEKHRNAMLKKGKPYQDEFRITTGDGRKRVLAMSMSATTNTQGQVTNYFGSMVIRNAAE